MKKHTYRGIEYCLRGIHRAYFILYLPISYRSRLKKYWEKQITEGGALYAETQKNSVAIYEWWSTDYYYNKAQAEYACHQCIDLVLETLNQHTHGEL